MKFENKFVVIRDVTCTSDFEVGSIVKLTNQQTDYLHGYEGKHGDTRYMLQTDLMPLKVLWNEGLRVLKDESSPFQRFEPKMGKSYYVIGDDDDMRRHGTKVKRRDKNDIEPYFVYDVDNPSDEWCEFSSDLVTKKQILNAGLDSLVGKTQCTFESDSNITVIEAIYGDHLETTHAPHLQFGRLFAIFNVRCRIFDTRFFHSMELAERYMQLGGMESDLFVPMRVQ